MILNWIEVAKLVYKEEFLQDTTIVVIYEFDFFFSSVLGILAHFELGALIFCNKITIRLFSVHFSYLYIHTQLLQFASIQFQY